MIATTTPVPYMDPTRSADERAGDLLARMTLDEKVAQMLCVWQRKPAMLVDDQGRFDAEKARQHFGHGHGLGQVGRASDAGGGLGARAMADLTNAIQKFFVEESRLGIPVVVHEECLHGHAAKEGTSFPQPIGLGATFDPGLVERLYAMTAAEARARGAHQALTPVVDVAREPRWGRVEETFGEDPHLVARLGVAAVRGFQGDARFADKRHVIATLKHFAAHGQPESGTNCAPVNVSMRVLRETFLSPFKAAIAEGGALSVMPSYNEIDGVPSHANRWLIEDVLRGEWGFRGFTVSDYFAIRELHETKTNATSHYVARDGRHAAELAVRTGVDIELPDIDCYPHLVDLVREGVIPESLVDDRVRPMLRAKFQLGLFDDPYVDPDEAERIVRDPAHRDLALEAARKTITLLKNEHGLLPIDAASVRRIAVIGPNADRVMLGGYSGTPIHASTVLQGIRDRVPPGVEVLHHEGCAITIGGSWQQDEVTPADAEANRRSIREAAALAATADVVILAIGDNEQTSREAWAANHLGDRPSLDLPGQQDELVDAVAATGKPVAALLFSGRPASAVNLVSEGGVDPRTVVPRAGNRPRGGRGAVRRREPGRQAAHHDPAVGRPPAGLLQLQAVRAAGLSLRHGRAAVSLRLRPELHHVRLRAPPPRQGRHRRRRHGQGVDRRDQHRRPSWRRGRAVVHPRPREQRHEAGEGAEGVPAHHAGPRRAAYRRLRRHAGAVGLLRHRHGVPGGAGRVPDHGRFVVSRPGPARGDAARRGLRSPAVTA